MSTNTALYERFRWSIADQQLEQAELAELNEIEQIVRAISEIDREDSEIYTTTSL